MPAADIIHDAVKNALIKDGWTITADPYVVEYETAKWYVDLAAEKPIAAVRAGQKIVVEVKSFVSASRMKELEGALGQYLIYHRFLGLTASEYQLYLAISHRVFASFFRKKVVELIVRHFELKLILVDIKKEEIVKWIK